MKVVYSMNPQQLDEYFQRMEIYFLATIMVESPEDRIDSYFELENYLGEYRQVSDNNDISDIMNHRFSTGTVLEMAIQSERIDLIPLFTQHGANINLRNSDGLSAIDMAVLSQNYQIIALLVPNETSTTHTASDSSAANITQVDDMPRVVYSSIDIVLHQLRLRGEESISHLYDHLGKAGDSTS